MEIGGIDHDTRTNVVSILSSGNRGIILCLGILYIVVGAAIPPTLFDECANATFFLMDSAYRRFVYLKSTWI